MDSGCGTCTTELASLVSSVSRSLTSEPQSRPVVQQSPSNGSYQQVGQRVTQVAKRPLAAPSAVPATCPAKPQQRQPAITRYYAVNCFLVLYCHLCLHSLTHCSTVIAQCWLSLCCSWVQHLQWMFCFSFVPNTLHMWAAVTWHFT